MKLKRVTYSWQSLFTECVIPILFVFLLVGGNTAELFGVGWALGWVSSVYLD